MASHPESFESTRFGGEESCFLLLETDREHAISLAERLWAAAAALAPEVDSVDALLERGGAVSRQRPPTPAPP